MPPRKRPTGDDTGRVDTKRHQADQKDPTSSPGVTTRSAAKLARSSDVVVPDSQPNEKLAYETARPASTILRRKSDGNTSSTRSIEPSMPLSQLFHYGYHMLVDAVYEFEMRRDHVMVQQLEPGQTRMIGIPFLASIPDKVLLGIINGTLAHDYYQGDPELAKLYGTPPQASGSSSVTGDTDWYLNGQRTAPGHYFRYLVNNEGQPPTPNQLLQAIEVMQAYVAPGSSNNQLAKTIDNIRGKKRASGETQIERRLYYFLCPIKNGPNRVRAHDRVVAIQGFCDVVEHRLNKLPAHLRDEPDVRPLSYVGYALQPSKRVYEHEKDHTSYMLGLLEHVFQYLKLDYAWDTFITSFATSAEEASFGQILINGLAQGYSDSGYGIAPHPAGMNCDSAEFRNKPYQDVQACWTDAESFRHNRTPWVQNMEREEKRYETASEIKEQVEQSRHDELKLRRAELEQDMPDLDEILKIGDIQLSAGATPADVERLRTFQDKLKQQVQAWEPVIQRAKQVLEDTKSLVT